VDDKSTTIPFPVLEEVSGVSRVSEERSGGVNALTDLGDVSRLDKV